MKPATTLARILRLYALALWVGGLVFFIAVAQIAFTHLASRHDAGLIVRHSLIALHTMGMIEGLIYALCTLLLLYTDRSRLRSTELLLVTAMLALTAYSQHGIIPRMERDRTTLQQQYNTEVDATPLDSPAHTDFDRLHAQSTRVEGTVLLVGLALLALAALPPQKHPAQNT